jgi:hypothetical protein
MVRKLIVKRRGYTRKDGTKVKATSFKIKDRGRPGRGKKIIGKLKEGSLGVDFSNKAQTRRTKESKLAKKIGEKKVVGKLRAVQVLNKRTNPKLSKKAKADAHFIASSFKGKKRVRTGTGLSSKKKR